MGSAIGGPFSVDAPYGPAEAPKLIATRAAERELFVEGGEDKALAEGDDRERAENFRCTLDRMGTVLRNQWAGLLALFLVLAGGGAYAAFQPIGPDGDIDACFEKRSGDLALLQGKKCGSGEKRVSWSETGPQGPQGPKGDAGVAGPTGPAGTAIVARPRFSGDQLGTLIPSPVPLTASSWTQGADEVDQFYGVAIIDVPSTAQCGPGNAAGVTVRVDNVAVLSLDLDSDAFGSPDPGRQFDLNVAARRAIFEPGQSTARTVTATFFDDCDGGTRFHLRQLKVDAVGVR